MRVHELLESEGLSASMGSSEAEADRMPASLGLFNKRLLADSRWKDQLRQSTSGDAEMEQYIMSRFHDPEATPSDDRPELLRVTQQLMKQNVKPKQLIAQITQASLDANLRAEAARVIDAEHIPMSLSDALLRRVLKVAQAIDESSWDADLLGLAGILSHPMSFVVELVLRKYDAAETLKVDQHAMKRMLRELERGYLANPYHCSIHGADVAYTLHVMLEKGVEGKLGLTKLQLVSSIIAAAAHDFRHNGLTNQYLVATNHPLALMYNDKAVLESMHASEFFSLLHSDKELNIFAKLEPASKSAVRKTVIASILATDMAVHFDFLSRFQSSIVAVERDLSASPYTADEQNFIISMLCHAADISNPAKNRRLPPPSTLAALTPHSSSPSPATLIPQP